MTSGALRDRTLVITGASRGIGRATALAVAVHEPQLILVGRAPGPLETVVQETRRRGASVQGLSLDVADPEAPAKLEGTLPNGRLDGLIHSAGVCDLGRVEDTSPEALDRAWQVNLRAPFLLTSRLLFALRAAEGHVVFVNSGAGKTAKAGWSAYAASKHGLRALADALREEVSKEGIRVTSVFPGRTATDMQAAVHEHEGKRYKPSDFVQPQDVAAAILTALLTPPPALVDEISVRPLPPRERPGPH